MSKEGKQGEVVCKKGEKGGELFTKERKKGEDKSRVSTSRRGINEESDEGSGDLQKNRKSSWKRRARTQSDKGGGDVTVQKRKEREDDDNPMEVDESKDGEKRRKLVDGDATIQQISAREANHLSGRTQ